MIGHNHTGLRLRSVVLFLIVTMMVGCNLPITGAGPIVWIDRPLEGDEAPSSQPLIIQAHASDPDGVARLHPWDARYGILDREPGRQRDDHRRDPQRLSLSDMGI